MVESVEALVVGNLVVNKKTGETWKGRNLKIQHKIPLDTLVEINLDYNEAHGCRLFVVEHNRDCDGSPLYSLSFEKSEYFKPIDTTKSSHKDSLQAKQLDKIKRMKMDHGWSDDCLIVIKEP